MRNLVVKKKDHYEIRQATTKGYDEAYVGDYVDLSFPTSNHRRARVGHGISNTLQASYVGGVVVDD